MNGTYIVNVKKSFKTLFKENYFVFNPVELKKKIVPLKRITPKYFIIVVIYYKEGGKTIKKKFKGEESYFKSILNVDEDVCVKLENIGNDENFIFEELSN